VISNLKEAVVLVTSEQSNIFEFGSGFPIYRTEESIYVLTCAHVVQDVGIEDVKVNGISATVVEIGQPLGCDLAILKINHVQGIETLPLSRGVTEGQKVVIAGYSQNETTVKMLGQVHATLGTQSPLRLNDTLTLAWNLQVDHSSSFTLQRGYSGSPVIDIKSGRAVGVVTQMKGEGRQGIAISIEEIEKVWSSIPNELIQDQLAQLEQELDTTEKEIDELSYIIDREKYQLAQVTDNSIYEDSLNWLSNGNQLAERLVSDTIKSFMNVEPSLQDEQVKEMLCLEIELYLELVHTSLLTQRVNILDEPCVQQTISNSEVYIFTLEQAKRRIPSSITMDEKQILTSRFDYLISRIS
jgi:sugar-specific transcriptional regulator TrmB